MGTASRVLRFPMLIPEGKTESNILPAWQTYGSSAGMWIYSPSDLAETVDIQVTHDPEPTAASEWFNYFDGATPAQITVPAAGTAQAYVLLVCTAGLKLVADSPVVADRTIWLSFQATN